MKLRYPARLIPDVSRPATTGQPAESIQDVILDVPVRALACYQLVTSIPRPSADGHGFAFQVLLYPGWKALMDELAAPTHDEQRHWLDTVGRELLEGCGYDLEVYGRFGTIRLAFGEWGLEHITIPGNGCGLDLTDESVQCPEGGRALLSHNVDVMKQAYLLQCIFNWWAHHWLLEARNR